MRNDIVKGGVAVLMLLIAAAVLVWYMNRKVGPEAESLWYADPVSGNMVSAPDEVPPTKTGLVRAFVFSCGECGDDKARFTGYFERFTPEAKMEMAKVGVLRYDGPGGISQLTEAEAAAYFTGGKRQIRRATESDWVDHDSEKGNAILDEVEKRCPSGAPHLCAGPASP